MLVTSVSAWGQSATVDGLFYWLDESSRTATVGSNHSGQLTGDIEIPSVISANGTFYTVTTIGYDAFYNQKITSVKLPNTLLEIGENAFFKCKELNSIDLANSVKTIQNQAFRGCEKLSTILNADAVEFMESSDIYNFPWYDNQPDGVVYLGKVLVAYKGAMPPNTTITVKDGTTQITRHAFSGCKNLVSVSLPNSLRKIEFGAFYGCTNLDDVSIPTSVVDIQQDAFSYTKWFNAMPDGEVYINDMLYTYKGKMPSNTSITVRPGTKSIATEAFFCKNNLKSIELPSTVTSIGDGAFRKSGLVSVTVPNSIETIGNDVFRQCSHLTTVQLPRSLKKMDFYVFESCNNLKEVTCLSESVPECSKYAFDNTSVESATLFVPRIAFDAYKNAKQWNRFGTIKTLEEMSDAVAPTLSRSQVHVSSTTYSSVTLTWIKATDDFTPKEDLKYTVYVNGQVFMQGYDIASCVVTGLKPSTNYTFLVSVEDLRGNVTKYDGARATTEARPVVIEKYPVLIEYKQITSENADDFWGDGGSIKYDPATKTLTLAWVDLFSDDDAISIYDDITIKLIGQNTVKGSIYADYTGELTFAGEGSINVKGSYPLYGWLSALVLKDGCTVELDATGYDSPGLGLDDCLLGVDHSTLKVKGGKGNRSIRAVTTFWMEGSEFESNHSYDKVNYMFLDATGKEATDEIIIAPIIKKIPMIADNSITIVNVDDTSATVAWMAATDDTTPQSELTYYIYSMKDGDYDFMYDADSKGMTSYTYTNLQPGTTYYVSVKVVDKDGNQVFYQDASFTTTTPDTSAPALSDDEIRVTDVTDNSIAIEWTKATDDRTVEDQLVYEVIYADNSSFADNYLMVLTDKNTATLKNLTPSTTYYIKVSVSDEASNHSEYRMLSVTTAEDLDVTAPTLADTKITVDAVTETSITVSWTAASDDRTAQDKLEYIVECTDVATGTTTEYSAGNANQYDITGLEPNTSYSINVIVKDEVGNFNRYDAVEARTNETPDVTAPIVVDSEICVDEVTDNSFSISWTAATDDRTAEENLMYTIEYKVSGTSAMTTIAIGNATSYTITDLLPATTYVVVVTVDDEAGNTASYQEQEIQTLDPDGILQIMTDNPDAKMYNIQGLNVGEGYRGLVIVNGKKYLKTK